MKYILGNTYHGFKLEKEEFVKEVNSTARIFRHEKSGARLLDLANDDNNKVFAIGFRTPPDDNTGVAHILEHSVLCGSRKFPTKEPFVELIKGSLNTFLNAMTFSDKTIYPLASKNEKDFYNLMDVYLDAVFYPNIYDTKEIMMQEGWHYDIDSPEKDLSYKGVVYNEMKGAYSSPDEVLMRDIQKSLFPDTTYGFESGGDPDYIPDLTPEYFLEFHNKYYHPSNSYIFLYGDGDLDKSLKFINDNYLVDFDKKEVDSEIKYQESFDGMKDIDEYYPIAKEDEVKDKTYLSLNFVTGDDKQEDIYLGLSTLEYLLLETQGAPLKQAILDANIGKDVYGSFNNTILQPVFSIIVKNSEKDKKDQFKKVVFDTLESLVKNGIDKKLIEACVNITEFKLREADFQGMPKGLFYYTTAMVSWLYGGDPLIHLKYEKAVETMKKGLNSSYFEDLIEKYLLKNNHSSLITLIPEKGLGEKKEEVLKEKLKQIKENMSPDEIDSLVNSTKELILRQQTPDSEEVLQTIPVLELSDINKNVEDLEISKSSIQGVEVLHHSAFTSKISYLTFMFDSSVINEDEIQYISLLSTLLGKLSTKTYSYSELSNEVLINTGGIYFKNDVYGNSKDTRDYKTFLEGHVSVVADKTSRGLQILADIIENTVFTDKKRIRELLSMLISRIEINLIERGHQVALMRLGSYFSPAYAYLEKTSGYEFYKFLKSLEGNFDSQIDDVTAKLESIMKKIFCKENMKVAITGEDEEVNQLEQNLDKVTSVLHSGNYDKHKYTFDRQSKNEGLLTPSNVQYVAKGFNYKELGYEYTGKLLVLKTILGMDYLWNKVRVQGGAYGAFASIIRSGNFMFASYRDPNIKKTLKVYDEASEYLAKFDTTDREMLKYIIGTISELDMPLTPSMQGDTALSNYMRGISKEDRVKEREQVLDTKIDDIRSFSSLVKAVMEQNFFVVLGNESKINENKDIFKKLENVFN